MMHRALLSATRQSPLHSSRAFSTSSLLLAKGRKSVRYAPQPPPAQATTTPGQAGTDVGHDSAPSSGGGLFEGEVGQEKVEEVSPDSLEKEMLASQGPLKKQVDGEGERENLAGTDVGGGGENGVEKISSAEQGEYGPEEIVYKTQSQYNVPLMLTVTYVFGVFAFAMGDFARAGVETYDEETGEYKRASKWVRYPLAAGAFALGGAIVVWGSLVPTRIITKLTLRRSPTSIRSSLPFPRDSLVTLYNPLTPLLQKLRIQPRTVPLSRLHLLGPLSPPKPYHPRFKEDAQKKSRFYTLLNKILPDPSPSKSAKKPIFEGTHVPFVIEGGRASYSLAVKRAKEMDAQKGAWCKDWEALERALLGVDEAKWARRS